MAIMSSDNRCSPASGSVSGMGMTLLTPEVVLSGISSAAGTEAAAAAAAAGTLW